MTTTETIGTPTETAEQPIGALAMRPCSGESRGADAGSATALSDVWR